MKHYTGDAYGRDAVHIAIVDEDGSVSGNKDNIIESFTYLSKASDARGLQGGVNYYKNVLADGSAYIYAGDTIYETNTRTQDFEPVGSKDFDLGAGADYTALMQVEHGIFHLLTSIQHMMSLEIDSINLEYLIMGPGLATETATKEKLNYIAGIAAERKDCMAFGSPHKGNIIATTGLPLANKDIVKNVKSFYNGVSSSSYLVLDCNYKYVYDRWNQKYCYIPCNSDVAGLVADTAIRQEPWFSPAGFSRGAIRNLAKLAWNPSKTDRDELYANRVNPISTFLVKVQFYLVTRQHLAHLVHSIESTFVVSSLLLKKQLKKLLRHNSLNSMMRLQEMCLKELLNHSYVTFNQEEEVLPIS